MHSVLGAGESDPHALGRRYRLGLAVAAALGAGAVGEALEQLAAEAAGDLTDEAIEQIEGAEGVADK